MVILKCCIQAKLTLPRLITGVWDIQNAQDHFLTPSWTGVMPYGSLIFSLRGQQAHHGRLGGIQGAIAACSNQTNACGSHYRSSVDYFDQLGSQLSASGFRDAR